MRDLILTELRECTRRLTGAKEENARLAAKVEELIKLSSMARDEGLLALEGEAENVDSAYLKNLVMLVVDGTDPALIEEQGLIRYFTSGSKGAEALEKLMQLYGVLALQTGENPRVIEMMLLAFLPDAAKIEYERLCDLAEMQEEARAVDTAIVEKFYTGELAVKPEDDAYYLVKVMDEILCGIPDRWIQRLLRDVEFSDVKFMMYALSGKARKRIFQNMSGRLSVMLARDMERMGRVRIDDAAASTYAALIIFLKLCNVGQFEYKDSKLKQEFAELLQADREQEGLTDAFQNGLRRLAGEYSSRLIGVLPPQGE